MWYDLFVLMWLLKLHGKSTVSTLTSMVIEGTLLWSQAYQPDMVIIDVSGNLSVVLNGQ